MWWWRSNSSTRLQAMTESSLKVFVSVVNFVSFHSAVEGIPWVACEFSWKVHNGNAIWLVLFDSLLLSLRKLTIEIRCFFKFICVTENSRFFQQAAIKCILPNICNGVFFGGMQKLVMYFDLDCSFDVQRFSNSLKTCIAEACGKGCTLSALRLEYYLGCEFDCNSSFLPFLMVVFNYIYCA